MSTDFNPPGLANDVNRGRGRTSRLEKAFDVFLCHNSEDNSIVKTIARELHEEGIRPWFDEWELPPGRSKQEEKEKQIKHVPAAAVFVGEMGLGPWQSHEVKALLMQFIERGCPVIPVLLPTCPEPVPNLPLFLREMEWVDFRKSNTDPLGRLIWGITGRKKDQPSQSRSDFDNHVNDKIDRAKAVSNVRWTRSHFATSLFAILLASSIHLATAPLLSNGNMIPMQRLLLALVFWLLASLPAWRFIDDSKKYFKFQGTYLKLLILIISTSLFLSLGLYPYAKDQLFEDGPARNPGIDLATLFSAPIAHAANESNIEIVDIYPNDELSSYLEDIVSHFSHGIVHGPIRTFAYNEKVIAARESGECVSEEGDRPIRDVLPLLREALQHRERSDLLRYVEDLDSYRSLMTSRGSRFADIVFEKTEIARMRTTDPAAFSIAAKWLVDCVGVENPVLTIVLRNTSNSRIAVSHIDYLVEDAYTVLGGETGPLNPSFTYEHVLPHQAGTHRRRLNPGFKAEPNDIGSFNVLIRPERVGRGLTWVLRIALVDDKGRSSISDRFQLIMSKGESR